MGILILGAGGHAKVTADILQMQNLEVDGFLDDDASLWNATVFGLRVFGALDQWLEFKPDGLILGIGSNRARAAVASRLGDAASSLWVNALHPSAVVARSVLLGKGIVVAANVVINPDARIEDHVIVNTGATIDHDCIIHAYAHIAPGTHLAGSVEIGKGALIGVGSGALPNTCVGQWTVIGAGATIVSNIPDNVVAKGTPARW